MNCERLVGLKPSDYCYPGEENAFNMLTKIPYIDKVLDIIMKFNVEMQFLPLYQGDCFRVTEKTCPRINSLYELAMHRLDMNQTIPLFIKPSFDFNACAFGGASPFICVHSSIVKNYTDEEMLVIFGHEIAHIKGKHSIYAQLATYLGQYLQRIPLLGGILTDAFYIALMQWIRIHELTCDRAGCIAAFDIDAGITSMAKTSGALSDLPNITFTQDSFLAQSKVFTTEKQDTVTAAISALLTMNMSHPWSIDRIQKLKEWKDTNELEQIVATHLP